MPFYEKIGFVCVSIVAFQVIKCVRRLVLIIFKERLQLQPDLKKQGKWAVIAGTEGLGQAFANAFARRGLNIILLGYPKDALGEITTKISITYNVETKFFFVDFTQSQNVYEELEKQFENYEIGILVNCVGLNYPYPELFIDVPYSNKNFRKCFSNVVFSQIITTNLYPVTHLCRIVLKGMCQRKKGIIINVSSTLAQITCPMMAVYASSKAYVSKFSADLAAEYYKDGIIVQCLQPGFINRHVNPISTFSWLKPKPDEYVESAILSLGVCDKTCGFIPHSALLFLYTVIEMLMRDHTRAMIRIWMEEAKRRALVRRYGGSSSNYVHMTYN